MSLSVKPNQQNNQRINPRLLGAEAVLTALLLFAFCGAFFDVAGVPCYIPVLILWCLFCGTGAVPAASVKKIRLPLIIAGTVFCLAVIFGAHSLFFDGFAVAGNGIKDFFGVVSGRIFLPFAVTAGCNQTLAVTVFTLPLAVLFSVPASHMVSGSGKIMSAIFFLCVIAAVIISLHFPSWYWSALCFASLLAVLLLHAGSKWSLSPAALGLLLAAALFAAGIPALAGADTEQPGFFAKAESAFASAVDSLRYGTDTKGCLPEGRFTGQGPVKAKEDTALEVSMSDPQPMYLRGFTGSIYTGSGWDRKDREEVYASKDMFYWLHEDGFYSCSQLDAAAGAASFDSTELTVNVRNLSGRTKYVYTPYEYSSASAAAGKTRAFDEGVLSADYKNGASVTYTARSNLVRSPEKLAQALETAGLRGGEGTETYLKDEASYREYVYENYLELDEDTRLLLASHLEDTASASQGGEHLSYGGAMQRILNLMLTSVVYNEECDTFSGGDFLAYFLEETAEGNSIHYATAATLLFRYYGIPARYVEGYIITPEDTAGRDEGEVLSIPGTNAHAWAEYYRDGIGWLPFEATPPYLYIMEQPDYISTLLPEDYDALNNQGGVTELTEDNYEDEEEEDKAEKEKSVPAGLIVAVSSFSLLMSALLAFAVLAVRRVLVLKKRRAVFGAASDGEAIDLYFADSLNILYGSTIKKENASLERYEKPLKDAGCGSLARLFKMMIPLHREASFSNHPVSPQRRELFRSFRAETVNDVKENASFVQRFKDKYIRNLY